MKLTFQFKNKGFEDSLDVTVMGETKRLRAAAEEICFEGVDSEELTLQVELIRKGEEERIKNPILRWTLGILLFPLILILLTVGFLADHDGGISIHKFFYDVNPFTLKKTFQIHPVSEAPIGLEFVKPKYDREGRTLSPPDLILRGAEVRAEERELHYDRKLMRQEFALYHYPAYGVLFLLLIGLNVLMALCLRGQLSPYDSAGVIGMGFCCAVTLALLVTFLCIFLCTLRLFRQVERNLTRDAQQPRWL